MRTALVMTLVLSALLALGDGCGSPGADVSRDELTEIVERDALSFGGSDIPNELIDQLATSKVIVLGETHHLREH